MACQVHVDLMTINNGIPAFGGQVRTSRMKDGKRVRKVEERERERRWDGERVRDREK